MLKLPWTVERFTRPLGRETFYAHGVVVTNAAGQEIAYIPDRETAETVVRTVNAVHYLNGRTVLEEGSHDEPVTV